MKYEVGDKVKHAFDHSLTGTVTEVHDVRVGDNGASRSQQRVWIVFHQNTPDQFEDWIDARYVLPA